MESEINRERERERRYGRVRKAEKWRGEITEKV